MAKRKNRPINRSRRGPPSTAATPVGVRIIGGRFRGRKLEYSGDLRTRPMKDRVREALFNLLSTAVEGKVAIDLFAGTGALALEALSRGASRAVLIERHRPTAETIRRNSASLGVQEIVDVTSSDTFLWARRLPDLGACAVACLLFATLRILRQPQGRHAATLESLDRNVPHRTVFLPSNSITASIFMNCPRLTSGTFAPIRQQSWGSGKSR